MLNVLPPKAKPHAGPGMNAMFRHFGALGLFSLAILDSSPIPTFAGPDILTAILSASHRGPWWEYAAMATAGSVVGAYLTFRLARKAGSAYLHSKFGSRKLEGMLNFFNRWGTSALAVSTAVPFPSPTSVLFAAAGASNYRTRRFLGVVAICRAARYATIALIADRYGRHFVRALRHPARYWYWLLLLAAVLLALMLMGLLLSRQAAPDAALGEANRATPKLPRSETSPPLAAGLPPQP